MMRRDRALSEVVTSLIFLLIVAVLGGSLYSYTLTVMGPQQNAFQDEIDFEAERAQERFRVISVWWSGSDDVLNLTVLNYGLLDIKISDVYVNGERVTSYQAGRNEEIYTSKLRSVIFTSPVPISQDVQYEIVLVTERGVSHVYNWRS